MTYRAPLAYYILNYTLSNKINGPLGTPRRSPHFRNAVTRWKKSFEKTFWRLKLHLQYGFLKFFLPLFLTLWRRFEYRVTERRENQAFPHLWSVKKPAENFQDSHFVAWNLFFRMVFSTFSLDCFSRSYSTLRGPISHYPGCTTREYSLPCTPCMCECAHVHQHIYAGRMADCPFSWCILDINAKSVYAYSSILPIRMIWLKV